MHLYTCMERSCSSTRRMQRQRLSPRDLPSRAARLRHMGTLTVRPPVARRAYAFAPCLPTTIVFVPSEMRFCPRVPRVSRTTEGIEGGNNAKQVRPTHPAYVSRRADSGAARRHHRQARGSGDRPDRLGSKGRVDDRSSPLKAEQQGLLRRRRSRSASTGRRMRRPTRSPAASTSSSPARARARSGPCSASSPTSRTTASPSPTGRSTTPRSGSRISAATTSWNLLFDETRGANSMRNFYIEQSSGRYTVARRRDRLGRRCRQPPDTTTTIRRLATSGTSSRTRSTAGTTQQIAAGKTPPQINAYLSQFDIWDRYDYDGDGNFDEPDGYIDTFQSVHAGEGEEAGGGALGAAAIWSHSWYAYSNLIGTAGPRLQQARRHPDRRQRLLGRQVHHPARERRRGRVHPRVRPRPGPARPVRHSGGENGTGFWTLMSSGSWMDDGKDTSATSPATWAPGRSSSSAG